MIKRHLANAKRWPAGIIKAMTTQQKKKLKKQISFETWRDRSFSIIVPGVLVYLLVTEGHNEQLKLIALILLVGFATGQTASIIRNVANSIAEGIIKSDGPRDGNKNSDSSSSDSRGKNVDSE